MTTTKQKLRKYDVSELDPNIRPQDDFFHYSNGIWIKKNPIPENESRWGSFVQLRFKTEKQLRTILAELEAKKHVSAGSPEQMVRDFYRSGMDMKRRNELGAAPLKQWQQMIQKIKNTDDLLKVVAEFHKLGVGVMWGAGIDQDAKNSERYLLHIGQDGLGLPDRDYYLKDDAESKRVFEAYKIHVKNVFRLLGQKPAQAAESAATVIRIETELAKVSMTKEDVREIEKIYHKYSIAKLAKHTPMLKWSEYLKRIGAGKITDVILMQPDFFTRVETMLTEVPLEDWKTYFEWHLVSDFAGLLSSAFINEAFNFYGKIMSGSKKIKPLWRRTLSAVNGSLDEVLGQIYVKKHFSPEAKKKMNLIVDDLFTAYAARIKQLDWMSPATKKKALLKLKMMTRKIGYPDKWESFRGLVIKPNDFVGNAVRSAEYEHRRTMRKLVKPVDRKEWHMSPQTVNAYCNQTMNEVVFPAAILQWPFFDLYADDAINYGSIGMVIGHEITHNFDDQGSKFDGKGNLKSWWTAEDKKKFEQKSKILVKQFNEYKVADGVSVNGQLTLGENVADLGGTSIAYDAYQLQLARTGRENIDGLSPEQRFFLGFSLFERESARPEFEKMVSLIDPHALPVFRINGTASNLLEFYKAFDVKKGDKLYRSPTEIAKIW